jgi:hypothetical protein
MERNYYEYNIKTDMDKMLWVAVNWTRVADKRPTTRLSSFGLCNCGELNYTSPLPRPHVARYYDLFLRFNKCKTFYSCSTLLRQLAYPTQWKGNISPRSQRPTRLDNTPKFAYYT